jgi:hypothetical protein
MSKDFVFPDPGVPKIPIERVDLYSEQAARYVHESKPFVAKVDWPALAWTPESLRQKIGDRTVKLRTRNGDPVSVTVNEYLDFIDNMRSGDGPYAPQNSPVISLRGRPDEVTAAVNPDFACLLPDLRWPSFVTDENMNSMFIWFKNMGCYDNRGHLEPNAAVNLNLQVRGKKHVWLFPPDDAPRVAARPTREDLFDPPYFSSGQAFYEPTPENPEFKDVRCYEAVLEPGDVIHIPTFWYHWFVHYDAYQMNVNCWFYNDQIPLSPIAGDWAYMKALAIALGGFAEAPARFAALPVETQELLTQIAHTLVVDPRCTNAQKGRELYRRAKLLQLDKKLLDKE